MSCSTRRKRHFLQLICLVWAGAGTALADQALVRELAETNVNQQYLVESVSISGVEVTYFHDARLTPTLRHRLARLVGSPCDMSAIGELAGKLRSSLHLQEVRERLSRGSSPNRVRVNFETVHKDYSFDVSVPRFLYDSDQGWTTELNASFHARAHSLAIGLGSNGDDLVERFTGFSTRYEDSHVFSDRLHFALAVEGYHDLWNPATRRATAGESTVNDSAAGASNSFALYRNRRNFAPELTFVLNRELSVSIGASFERMEMEESSPAGNEMSASANAATADLNFAYGGDGGGAGQRWDGHYGIRVATHDLGSDYLYTRHQISLRYERRSGKNLIADKLTGGVIMGEAPLFERFVLGNSSELPGWNRYSLDPLGGDRMVNNTLSYGHQFPQGTAEIFYDAGFIGEGDHLGTLRHAAGVGFRQGVFNVAMAFPIYEGRIAPVFTAGMNY